MQVRVAAVHASGRPELTLPTTAVVRCAGSEVETCQRQRIVPPAVDPFVGYTH